MYDGAGRVTAKIYKTASGVEEGTAHFVYDEAGNVTLESFGGDSVTRSYDGRGRLTSVTMNARTVSFEYNNDNTLALKDGMSFAYNPQGQLTKVSKNDGSTDQAEFTYDSFGRVKTLTLPGNVTRTYGYNTVGRMTALTQQAGTVETDNFTYGYDALGRLTKLTAGDYALNFSYDAGGRLVSESRTGADAYRHNYTYDKNDNRTRQESYIAPTLTTNVLDFNGGSVPAEVAAVSGLWSLVGGELQGSGTTTVKGEARASLTLPGVATGYYEVKVRPDVSGLAVGEEVTAGICLGQTAEGRYVVGVRAFKVTEFGSTVLKRRLELRWVPTTGAAVVEAGGEVMAYGGETLTLALELQSADKSVSVTVAEDGGLSGYAGVVARASSPCTAGFGLMVVSGVAQPPQPVKAWFDDFKWETLSGTATSNDYLYDNMNRLLSISGSDNATFTYDASGLGLLKTQVKNGETTDYGYDRLNRLTGMTVERAALPVEVNSYTYYGPTWMRATADTPQGMTRYIYDGYACIEQTTGGVTTKYAVPGQEPLWERTGNKTLTYTQDGRGNVAGLWNGSTFDRRFRYDAFGQVKEFDHSWTPITLKSSGPRYRGQLYDAGTDQVYLRNRYYSPGTGRFNAPDPIGYSGGMNLYGYCGGDPVNRTDMMGQKWHMVNGELVWVDEGESLEELEMELAKYETRKFELIYALRQNEQELQQYSVNNFDPEYRSVSGRMGFLADQMDQIRRAMSALPSENEVDKIRRSVAGMRENRAIAAAKAEEERQAELFRQQIQFMEGLLEAVMPGYLEQSLNQFVKGNYTEDVTLLGTAGQVGAGLFGVDLPMDIRDLTHDFGNWNWSWSHAGKTGIDAVGLIPGIGVLKNADECGILLKRLKQEAQVLLETTKDGIKVLRHGKAYRDILAKKLEKYLPDWNMWHFEEHHIFFKCLGGSDEAANKILTQAYLHRGAGIGIHQFVAGRLGTFQKLTSEWDAARTILQKRAFIGKVRSAYSDYFKGSPDYDEIMKLIDQGLSTVIK